MKNTRFLLFVLLGFSCASLVADVIVHTKSGRSHVVPVAPADVASIEFVSNDSTTPTTTIPSVSTPTSTAVGEPWLVNSDGIIFRGDGRTWKELPGRAYDIGIGADGSVWVIGFDNVPGGHSIHRWTGSAWAQIDGGAVRVAVGPKGEPWIVNSDGRIFRGDGRTWQELPGRAYDIGVGADGSVWVIGFGNVQGGHSIHRWTGSDWQQIEGGAVRIAVGPRGEPWIVNSEGRIFRGDGRTWQLLPGLATDIGAGASGAVWIIGADNVPGGHSIYRWTGSDWGKIEGGAVGISVR